MSKDKPSDGSNGAKLCFIHRGSMPFLALIIFSAAFFIFSKTLHPFLGDIDTGDMLDKFQKYSPYAGAALGILSMILMYILYIFRRLFRLHKTRYSAPVVLIIGYAPWLILGYDLAFLEPRYAMIVRAIISFGGKPMFYSSVVMAGLGILWLIVTPFMKRK
jgi:hypothetical protein